MGTIFVLLFLILSLGFAMSLLYPALFRHVLPASWSRKQVIILFLGAWILTGIGVGITSVAPVQSHTPLSAVKNNITGTVKGTSIVASTQVVSRTPTIVVTHTTTPTKLSGISTVPQSISIVITHPAGVASPGDTVTEGIQTTVGAACSIIVNYKSGPSHAKGLQPQQADAGGDVAWSWFVGTNTTPGIWPIDITCSLSSGKSSEVHDTLAVQ